MKYIFSFLLILLFASCYPEENRTKALAKEFILSFANDPSAVKTHGVDAKKFHDTTTNQYYWLVTYDFSSKNGFGATVREKPLFKITGDTILTVDGETVNYIKKK